MEGVVGLLERAVRDHPTDLAIHDRLSDRTFTYRDVLTNATVIGGFLQGQLNVGKGDRVAIISDNVPEFMFTDFGVLSTGATSVPIDQSLTGKAQAFSTAVDKTELLASYFADADPKVIMVQNVYYDAVRKAAPEGVEIVRFGVPGRRSPEVSGGIDLDRVREVTTRFCLSSVDVSDDDISTIIFSSGSTAESADIFKGIQLTFGNIRTNVEASMQMLGVQGDEIYLTGLLTHWHSFEYMVQKAFLSGGGELHFTDRASFVRGDGAKINPTHMIMIPGIAKEIMRKTYLETRRKKGKAAKERFGKRAGEIVGRFAEYAFRAAMWNSKQYVFDVVNNGRCNPVREWVHQFFDAKIYSQARAKLHQKFGTNLRMFIGGSAPLELDVANFFYALGMPIFQGYGLTETSPVVSVNTPENCRLGSSGKLIPGVEVRIVDPDTGRDTNGWGMVYIRGPNIFHSYRNKPEKTAAVKLEGGWFNSEDKGMLDDDGYLFISGRYKDQIVLAGGEKMAPEPVEGFYSKRGDVERLILVGTGYKTLGAIVVPTEEAMESHTTDELAVSIQREISVDCRKRFGLSIPTVHILPELDPKYLTGKLTVRRNMFLAENLCILKEMYGR